MNCCAAATRGRRLERAPGPRGLERGARDRTVPPHGHPPPRPVAPGRGQRVPGQPGPVRRLAPRGPLRTLDDFYLVNRAGRWSAAARQAYLLREPLVQPLRRPGRPGRPRRSAARPDHRPAAPRRAGGAVPGTARPAPGGQRLEVRAADTAGPGRGERRCGSGRATRERPTRAARRTGGGPTGTRWPGCCAITPWTWAPRRDVRDRPPVGGRAGAGPAAAGRARRLGPGHPGRAAVRRLAERPRGCRGQPRPYRVSACQKYTTPTASVTTAQPTAASQSSLGTTVGWQ